MSQKKPELLPMADINCCGPKPQSTASCCGGPQPSVKYSDNRDWLDGSVRTSIGEVPRVTTRLTRQDHIGHWKVRWGIDRMRYAIAPGLYAVGNPTPESHVFVSANYKMSFDHLRAALDGRDSWILVLDTKGINVWCAAGKGTFGTEELVRRILATHLTELVTHRKLIVPQLGAPGVAAHEVRKATGFTVRFGPVRAADISAWLDSNLKASDEMRRVNFPVHDRLVLIPVELVQWAKWGIIITAVLGLLSGFGSNFFSLDRALWHSLRAALPILGGLAAGAILTPLLLPWLPGRAFASKGAWAGALYLLILSAVLFVAPNAAPGWIDWIAWPLLVVSTASFVGMNFTGASTYTSLSGVRKEMRTAVPIQAVAAVIGLGFWIAGRFV
jgi:hypothetical protein